MKIGDRIKTFEVKDIVERIVNGYNERGIKKRVLRKFALLLSDNGQKRVLRVDRIKLDECEMYYNTFSGFKYKDWNQI